MRIVNNKIYIARGETPTYSASIIDRLTGAPLVIDRGLYEKTDGEFNVYYYYWNRHNDNKLPNEMGIMEFAVVRNNVYKLCVDKIAKYGHPDPTDPDPVDPDPVDPTDPDETGEYYFKVTVKVLPWVVRVNHIEF